MSTFYNFVPLQRRNLGLISASIIMFFHIYCADNQIYNWNYSNWQLMRMICKIFIHFAVEVNYYDGRLREKSE